MRQVDVSELRRRKWPVPPFGVDPEIRNDNLRLNYSNLPKPANYEVGARVAEGSVTAYALGRTGDPASIQPGESAITSLAMGTDGRLFGATSGRKSHLFVYDPDDEDVRSLAVIGQSCGVTRALVTSPDGLILGGTREQDGRVFRCDPNSARPQVETIAVPIEKEGMARLVLGRDSHTLYGLTTPAGVFFALDLASGRVRFREQIDEAGLFSEAIVVAADGSVWGASRWGQLFRYREGYHQLERLSIKTPCVPGREMYTAVDAFAAADENGCLYGGEHADGMFFRLDPSAMTITCLGKPTPHPYIRDLTVGKDGCVYGVSGRKGGMCHLFRHHPATGESRTLGVLFTMVPRHWYGYEFEAMAAGPGGDIYLGESDRISHLFVYRPRG